MSQAESPKSIHVLLIEDDEDDYVLMRDALRGFGPERLVLDWHDDVEQALETLCQGRHDVALLDYHLGAHTGPELLTQARQRGCIVPVILLTGVGDVEHQRKAREAGAFDFLVKSEVSAGLMERALRSVLQQARAGEARKE
jgi:DNA-binding response OmpR family regulator